MPAFSELILGEFTRTIDERYRLSLPGELLEPLMLGTSEAILAKERPGALSLWNAAVWQEKLDAGLALVHGKMRAGKLEGRWDEVQSLGRLLSTRHRGVPLAGRGRLVIPDGFREFLAVPAGSEILLIGAGVCVEIWQPEAWLQFAAVQMPAFRQLFDRLTE
jgi:MraZ protein